jgi:hypothetical protein
VLSAQPAIERDNYIYHFDNPVFVQTADSALNEARTRLFGILGDSLRYRPDIYISDNLKQFKELVGTAFPDWGAAVAIPHRRLMAVKSPAHFPLGRSLREFLAHEYTHLALEDRLRHRPAPRWLDEGLAMYISSEWGWEQNLVMTRAVIFGSIIPLDEIEKLNQFSGGKAQIAYSESYLAVKYLLDNYGRESFYIFLDGIAERKSIDQALMAAIGSNYGGFEKEYFGYLQQRYTLMSFFVDTIYLWIVLALVVAVGFIFYLKRRRKYFSRWDDEDRYQSRDFDYGDPDNPEQVEDDEDKPWS